MKKWFINFVTFHIVPLILCIILILIGLYYFEKQLIKQEVKTLRIKGEQLRLSGAFANCVGDQIELELAGNLNNPNSLTLFGSSEFQSFEYSSYYYLPDSIQMPTVGFGNAHHQSFAMYCELLAMQKQINKSKICIFISPGWFETEGTNIEAFLEFVRPNFLKSIVHNNDIPLSNKLEIGKYITSNITNIDEPSQSLNYFKNLYTSQNIPFLNSIIEKGKSKIGNVQYSVKLARNILEKKNKIDIASTKKRLQNKFVSSIKSNSFFINDEYYKTYLVDENGVYHRGTTPSFNVSSNREFADLKLLVQFLKRNKCKASFVIQPLNVYHYKNLENYNEIMDSIVQLIKKNDFPFLNLFVTKKQDFEPGILNDIMHLGDYGWMRVNEFLIKTYKSRK